MTTQQTQIADLEKELITTGVGVLQQAKTALVQVAAQQQPQLTQQLSDIEDHVAQVALSFIPHAYQADVQALFTPIEEAAKQQLNAHVQQAVASGVARIQAAIFGALAHHQQAGSTTAPPKA